MSTKPAIFSSFVQSLPYRTSGTSKIKNNTKQKRSWSSRFCLPFCITRLHFVCYRNRRADHLLLCSSTAPLFSLLFLEAIFLFLFHSPLHSRATRRTLKTSTNKKSMKHEPLFRFRIFPLLRCFPSLFPTSFKNFQRLLLVKTASRLCDVTRTWRRKAFSFSLLRVLSRSFVSSAFPAKLAKAKQADVPVLLRGVHEHFGKLAQNKWNYSRVRTLQCQAMLVAATTLIIANS